MPAPWFSNENQSGTGLNPMGMRTTILQVWWAVFAGQVLVSPVRRWARRSGAEREPKQLRHAEPAALGQLRRPRGRDTEVGQRVARQQTDEDFGHDPATGRPELLGNSRQLGPAGGRIVAEVLIGLLAGDPLSYLSVAPAWTPELAEGGRFGMPELLRFALGA